MKFIVIDEKSPYLEKVIRLGDVNKSKLGLLPRGAFIALAAQRLILCALDGKDKLCGYLLYGVNKTYCFYYISHLCVKESQRGKGIAKALFEAFKNRTQKHYKGVRVHCRIDYEANKIWPKLGFFARHEIDGKSKYGSKLTVWWYDYGYPNLFSDAGEQRTQLKLKVAIDANIFYQLRENPSDHNEEAQSLLADWLQENIELCLTVEMYNEIERKQNEDERKQDRIFADRFMKLPIQPEDNFSEICKKLQSFFPQQMRESDESDLRQLARTIAANVQFFITQDEGLLKKSEDIYEVFNIRIIHPSDLIIQQDYLLRDAEYQPARLSGSQLGIEHIRSEQLSYLKEFFRDHQKEKKSEFANKLSRYLSDPRNFQTDIIQEKNHPLALRIFDRSERQELEIPLLRISAGPLSSILARHIVFQSVLTSSDEGRILTKITDNYLSDEIIGALRENNFVCLGNIWVKMNLPTVATSTEIISELKSFRKLLPQYCDELSDLIAKSVSDNNIELLLKIERALFPAKITDINIPAFIIPIRDRWAMSLFDAEIAGQSLFGADPSLMLNTENVYYSASRSKISPPARILWYVSKSKTYQGDQSVKACSYLDEIVSDTPKALFSKFQRFGVYKWQDVSETAGNDLGKKIKAFRFSNTELFKKPITLKHLKEIWSEKDGKSFYPPQSLRPVSIQNFFISTGLGDS